MKTKTVIVLVPLKKCLSGRKELERIENEVFENREHILKQFPVIDQEHISILYLTDFMDEFNNEEIEQSEFFIGYVHIKN